jgi:hypothetical protein
MTLAGVKRHKVQFVSIEEREKWIEDYLQTESAGARKRVEDADTAN